jgi:hypothetical protein
VSSWRWHGACASVCSRNAPRPGMARFRTTRTPKHGHMLAEYPDGGLRAQTAAALTRAAKVRLAGESEGGRAAEQSRLSSKTLRRSEGRSRIIPVAPGRQTNQATPGRPGRRTGLLQSSSRRRPRYLRPGGGAS